MSEPKVTTLDGAFRLTDDPTKIRAHGVVLPGATISVRLYQNGLGAAAAVTAVTANAQTGAWESTFHNTNPATTYLVEAAFDDESETLFVANPDAYTPISITGVVGPKATDDKTPEASKGPLPPILHGNCPQAQFSSTLWVGEPVTVSWVNVSWSGTPGVDLRFHYTGLKQWAVAVYHPGSHTWEFPLPTAGADMLVTATWGVLVYEALLVQEPGGAWTLIPITQVTSPQIPI